jgi:thioredoxin-like negative regulator of GroEL
VCLPSHVQVVLEFFKSRSPASKRLLPKLEAEGTKRNDVIFLKVNVDMLTVRCTFFTAFSHTT